MTAGSWESAIQDLPFCLISTNSDPSHLDNSEESANWAKTCSKFLSAIQTRISGSRSAQTAQVYRIFWWNLHQQTAAKIREIGLHFALQMVEPIKSRPNVISLSRDEETRPPRRLPAFAQLKNLKKLIGNFAKTFGSRFPKFSPTWKPFWIFAWIIFIGSIGREEKKCGENMRAVINLGECKSASWQSRWHVPTWRHPYDPSTHLEDPHSFTGDAETVCTDCLLSGTLIW